MESSMGRVATQPAMDCRGMGSAEEEGQGTTVGAKHNSDQSARERGQGRWRWWGSNLLVRDNAAAMQATIAGNKGCTFGYSHPTSLMISKAAS